MTNRYIAASCPLKVEDQAHLHTGITSGQENSEGALQPISQISGSYLSAFFALLVAYCCFCAFPSPNTWALCQAWALYKHSALRGCQVVMLQENTGLFLQRFEAIILISHFFRIGNSFKGWNIITLWNRFISYQVFCLCQVVLKVKCFGGRIS